MYDQVHKEGATARTRYFERATTLIKRAVQLLIYTSFLVRTENMIADILTKATDQSTFVRARNIIMNTNSSLLTQLAKAAIFTHGSVNRMVSRIRSRIYSTD